MIIATKVEKEIQPIHRISFIFLCYRSAKRFCGCHARALSLFGYIGEVANVFIWDDRRIVAALSLHTLKLEFIYMDTGVSNYRNWSVNVWKLGPGCSGKDS